MLRAEHSVRFLANGATVPACLVLKKQRTALFRSVPSCDCCGVLPRT